MTLRIQTANRSLGHLRWTARDLRLVMTLWFVVAAVHVAAAGDATCFPLVEYVVPPGSKLLKTYDPQKDLELALELETNGTLSSADISALVDPSLQQRLDVLRSLVLGSSGVSVDISSGFRPLAYQQHFYTIKKQFDALLDPVSGAGAYYKYDPVEGQIVPRPGIIIPPGVIAANQGVVDCVNEEQSKHHIKTKIKKGDIYQMSVMEPSKSKHPLGLAIDLPVSQIVTDTGLKLGKFLSLAHQAGLFRPYPKTDNVHFEMLGKWGLSQDLDGSYACEMKGTETFPFSNGSRAWNSVILDSLNFGVDHGAITVTLPASGSGVVLPNGTAIFSFSNQYGGTSSFQGVIKKSFMFPSGGGTWQADFHDPGYGYSAGTGSGTWTIQGF